MSGGGGGTPLGRLPSFPNGLLFLVGVADEPEGTVRGAGELNGVAVGIFAADLVRVGEVNWGIAE
jgi:hypothetical protein